MSKKPKLTEKEQVQKDIKTINTAGKSAATLGWLGLVLLPLYFAGFGLSGQPSAVGRFLLGSTLCVVYILGGAYIQRSKNKSTRRVLLFNAISSLLLFRGIIPLFVCAESFWGQAAMKRLLALEPNSDKTTKQHIGLYKKELIIMAVILVAGFVAVSIPNGLSKKTIPADAQTQINTQKASVDSLKTQYDTCNSALLSRQSMIDKTTQSEVDKYNADIASCNATRDQYNTAADSYNALLRQYQ